MKNRETARSGNQVRTFNIKDMKRILYHMAVLCMAATAFGCSGFEEDQSINVQAQENEWIITLGLPNHEPDTRLSYEEVDIAGKKAVKTTWESDDEIFINATPGNTSYVFRFRLKNGAGTPIGVFRCDASSTGLPPYLYSTNAWTIYFSEKEVRSDNSFFNFSYTGQIQKGNCSMDHLGAAHSLRLLCTSIDEKSYFKNSFIDLSGENVSESSCMKFNLSGLPSIIPVEIELQYFNAAGMTQPCFHEYNYLDEFWSGATPNSTCSSSMTLKLEDFTSTSSITAYMMMSNYPANVEKGGKFRVYVRDSEGNRYYCDKQINRDAVLEGGKLHSITCSSWTRIEKTADGFDDPENGIIVLQEASKGSGTDIVIMGDGFDKNQFDGTYDSVMRTAYNNFFSVEPYRSLQDYFNVYYINAVSQDSHDAEPYYDAYGNQNGASNGSAVTEFETLFVPGATTITGNNSRAIEYAKQAILTKGNVSNAAEAETRANKALIMVMVNVRCHAGTCYSVWTYGSDYGNAYSVAYTALGNNEAHGKWTMIHEAGGHGFGKLADEYGGRVITSFNTGSWNELKSNHGYGVYRNVDAHWSAEDLNDGWSVNLSDTYTDESNVYWAELLNESYGYKADENLGIYRGGFTYDNLYCRPTDNSVMRSQFMGWGGFFNAISRWAIWYRLMKLTGSTSAPDFKSSLDEFITFDKTLTIEKNPEYITTKSDENVDGYLPLAPPVLIEGRWVEGKLITY